MPDRELVLSALLKRIEPSAEKIVNGTGIDHDVFPALLWMLLENQSSTGEMLTKILNQNERESDLTKTSILNLESASREARNALHEVSRLITQKQVEQLAAIQEARRGLEETNLSIAQKQEERSASILTALVKVHEAGKSERERIRKECAEATISLDQLLTELQISTLKNNKQVYILILISSTAVAISAAAIILQLLQHLAWI